MACKCFPRYSPIVRGIHWWPLMYSLHIYCVILSKTLNKQSKHWWSEISWYFDGILPKGPYPPCLRMADRTLLVGYPRFMLHNCNVICIRSCVVLLCCRYIKICWVSVCDPYLHSARSLHMRWGIRVAGPTPLEVIPNDTDTNWPLTKQTHTHTHPHSHKSHTRLEPCA